jgi:hypothetical protein
MISRSILIFLLSWIPFCASAQTDSASINDTLGLISLDIYTNVEGAEVFLDTIKLGYAPLEKVKVKKGKYLLKLINPGRPGFWQNENIEKNVSLTKDTAVTANFFYYYDFKSTPSDARVIRNDTLLGLTPLMFRSSYLMKGLVLFKKENYKEHFFDMNTYDPVSGVNVTLKLKDNAKVEEQVRKNKGTQFKTSRNVPVIVGLAAASLAAGYFTYVFKTRANEQYAEYAITGDLETLDESKQNDTYFAIALVLMQAAIGGLVYFLFFD